MTVSRTILALSLALIGSQAAAADPYFRFPAVRGDTIVFTAEGDLWRTTTAGGKATRLTTHPSAETHAAISHDGKLVAFAASYEGAQEAYVMPLEGGLPKRITFENGGVTVLGWTAQGEVLVSTENSVGPAKHRVVAALDPATMKRRVLPLADANDATLDDAGKVVYFTRMGLSMTNDNVRSYRGGAHAQLWRFDLDAKGEATQLFKDDTANNRRAMWHQGRLYFISDADGADNIWSSLPDGSDRRAHTSHKEWDVRTASLGDGRIVYQLGADLRVLDLASGADSLLKASLVSDFDQQRMRRVKSPLDALTGIEPANKAERIVLTARGRVTIAGTGTYRRVEIAVPEGVRARSAVFSHDDKWVYAITDASGENEIWRYAADGSGQGDRLTRDGAAHRWNLYPSPDGKWLAHTDKKGRTWLLDLAAKSNVVIDDAGQIGVDRLEQVVWSPDSRNLALVRTGSSEQRNQIGLYSLGSKQMSFVTTDRYEANSPAFSPDGKWLYFLSARHFNLGNASVWGDRNMGPVFDDRVGVYALALQPDTRFPFKPEDELTKPEEMSPEAAAKAAVKTPGADEQTADKQAAVAAAAAATSAANAASSDKPKKPTPAIIYAGLRERLYEVPVAPGNYRALAVDDKRLYLLDSDDGQKGVLKTLEISRSAPQPETFASNVREFGLSTDRKHVFYRTFAKGAPGDMLIVSAGAKAPADLTKAKVKIDDWAVITNPRLEWTQMFNDAWRMHRDFLYDAKMRGVDWNAVRTRYAPLVDRVTDRAELDDVLGMMVGEVGALHSQIRPGDVRRATGEGTPSSLGAVLTRTAEGYRVDRVYRSEPELPSEAGPLSLPDVGVKEGDVITAVNGKSLVEARDIADLLLDQADKQVLLQVKTLDAKPRQVIVTPVSMARHASLRYTDWEQSRARQVDEASKGKIGYLHLRAMVARDINAFARDFYANINKEGLIIDVRRNNGGNIDSWIIEKLLRRSWAFWASNGNQPQSNMQNTFRGHLVVLADELTYSDGETFTAGVKALKLGPVVGKRTAGAGVWLSDGNGLTDNGMARVAEFGQFSSEGEWLIEGVGVSPDVEVDNLPHETFKGRDRQLEVALEMLEKKMKEQPVKAWKPAAIPALKR
ncbi:MULTISPECIES: S41 family peptidase [unclassified Massilia]|uniref:S41 family peptidase n=1 Tax=unclassified Massilia TaxID=2609279 RepID=UPI001B82670E|nr:MULTISPECIES: S41 family peptidase [unclassified Massilia]MBQ5942195.1 PDZ domain-containing protein [Massilia sp. AB1]MBQ5964870.1 PDZ domain-containing protein [Massilia sp. ZL223]